MNRWGLTQNQFPSSESEMFMRTRWAVLVVAFVIGCSLSAFAGPGIVIGDPSCNTWNTANGPLINVSTANSFSLTTNQIGGGYFGVCNQSGQQWNFVDFKFLADLQPGDITCDGSDVFQNCSITAFTGGIDILFFNPPGTNCNGDNCGIPKDQLMTINLNKNGCIPTARNSCSNNDGDWPSFLTIFGGTNQSAVIPTPEPTTMALLGAGLIAVVRFRRRK
jgi:hypothetical protein